MSGFILMSALLLTHGGGEWPQTSDTVVFYPREAITGAIELAEAGDYALWILAMPGTEAHVTAGAHRFEFEPKRDREDQDEPLWHKAGNLQLQAGILAVESAPATLLVALSKASDFDPQIILSDTRVLPFSESLGDKRATRERHTNTVFTMAHYETIEDWEAQAAILRMRILLGAGLYPLPEKTPLQARIFDESVHEGYAVSKVHFEPWPGLLATGNLYRPLGDGSYPAVVNPHGHWEQGRLEDSERCSVAARCITLARMGAVAFSYDMIGYVDSRQTSHNWGRDHEKLWGLHTFGIQLWTSIRAVDFMETLPYVDAERIGCTGASGGGTQTFALTAVDPRIRVSAPVNMISSTMQGGCLCENAPVLRLDNSNMEVGALAAPRPLLLVSTTGDWTRETPRVEYPAIKSIYALHGAADKVTNVHLDYGHNYNLASREAMYRFFGEHLLGGDFEDFTEPAYVMPAVEALRVFPGEDPPAGYPRSKALLTALVDQARARRAARLPQSADEIEPFQNEYKGAFPALLGAETPHVNTLQSERTAMEQRNAYVLERWIIGRTDQGDSIPALLYRGADAEKQDAVIVVHGRGKAWLTDWERGGPGPLVAALIEKGKMVLVVDAFLTGEYHGAERAQRRNDAFQDTFHPTDTGHRVQDVLTAKAFLRARYDATGIVDVIGLESAGLWCLLAGAVDDGLRLIVSDMNHMNFEDDAHWEREYYVPAIRALGDIPAALACGGPQRFRLFNMIPNDDVTHLDTYALAGPLSPSELVELIP